jgi:hypothetical protein
MKSVIKLNFNTEPFLSLVEIQVFLILVWIWLWNDEIRGAGHGPWAMSHESLPVAL